MNSIQAKDEIFGLIPKLKYPSKTQAHAKLALKE